MSNDEQVERVVRESCEATQQQMRDDDKENWKLMELNWKFQSREDLISVLREFFSMHGYTISIKNSTKDKCIHFGCDRGGRYRNNWHVPMEHRKKKTTTCLIDCPFDIRSKRLVDGSWIVEVKNSAHNHEPSSDMSGHPSCRRLSKDEITSIAELTKSGIPPRQILSTLRQRNPNILAVSRTIYNMKAKLQRDNIAGRSLIQTLLEELRQGDFVFNVVHDLDRRLTNLFFAHPSSITLAQSYSNVFVMDCTYKTNKYKMPLLEIVGVSSFNTSFYSCFAFLEKEDEENYTWAMKMFHKMLGSNRQPSVIVSDRELALMNAIEVVFPTTKNLLCVWHIEKNILANCKSSFQTQDDWNAFLGMWNQLIESQDELTYEENWKNIEFSYKEKEKVLYYLKKVWLPFKDRFVKAWTDRYTHLGNRVTSRAEGAHAKLKRYIQVSTGNLLEVKNKITLAIANEFKEITTQLSSEKIRALRKCNIPFCKDLVTNVSMFAMGELMKQYDMIKEGTVQPLCTGNFYRSMGLPCAHMMMSQKGTPLPLDIIHSQWRIDARSITSLEKEKIDVGDTIKKLLGDLEDQYKELPEAQKEHVQGALSQFIPPSSVLLLEPNVQIHKGRPVGSKNKSASSTKRNASAFEIKEATRKCSNCHGVGQNSRTCRKNFGRMRLLLRRLT